jgi:hypothetical protein
MYKNTSHAVLSCVREDVRPFDILFARFPRKTFEREGEIIHAFADILYRMFLNRWIRIDFGQYIRFSGRTKQAEIDKIYLDALVKDGYFTKKVGNPRFPNTDEYAPTEKMILLCMAYTYQN